MSMKAYELKNVVKNALYFLENERPFTIMDDPHNCLDLFLVELNRLRQMINLPPYVLDKIIKMPSGGYQRRFTQSTAGNKDDSEDEPEEPQQSSTRCEFKCEAESLHKMTITKTRFIKLMEEMFGENVSTSVDSMFDEDLDKHIRATKFHLGDIHVGTWAAGKGTYKKV